MKKAKKNIKNIGFKGVSLIIVVASAILFPKLGWWAADYIGNIFGYKQFSILWDIVHHIVQVLPVIVIIKLPFWGKSLSDWGFNNNEKEKTINIIIKFTLGFIVFFTFGKFIFLYLNGWSQSLGFDPNVKSVFSIILYRLIMPGLSEELVFRAYIMGILMTVWKGVIDFRKFRLPVAGIISALIFVMAHVGFTLYPFQITYYVTGQLISAFVFGIYYSIIFYETKSILAPIVCHNVIDGLGTLIDWLLISLINYF